MFTYIIYGLIIIFAIIGVYIVVSTDITLKVVKCIYPRRGRSEVIQLTRSYIYHSLSTLWKMRKTFRECEYGTPDWVAAENNLAKTIDRAAMIIEMKGINPYVELLTCLLPNNYPEKSYLPVMSQVRAAYVQEVMQMLVVSDAMVLGPIGHPKCSPKLIISTICRILILSGKQTVITNETKYTNFYFGAGDIKK